MQIIVFTIYHEWTYTDRKLTACLHAHRPSIAGTQSPNKGVQVGTVVGIDFCAWENNLDCVADIVIPEEQSKCTTRMRTAIVNASSISEDRCGCHRHFQVWTFRVKLKTKILPTGCILLISSMWPHFKNREVITTCDVAALKEVAKFRTLDGEGIFLYDICLHAGVVTFYMYCRAEH